MDASTPQEGAALLCAAAPSSPVQAVFVAPCATAPPRSPRGDTSSGIMSPIAASTASHNAAARPTPSPSAMGSAEMVVAMPLTRSASDPQLGAHLQTTQQVSMLAVTSVIPQDSAAPQPVQQWAEAVPTWSQAQSSTQVDVTQKVDIAEVPSRILGAPRGSCPDARPDYKSSIRL